MTETTTRAAGSAEGYAQANALVETDAVDDLVKNGNVRLIEVDVDTNSYNTGHIPGALGWDWQQDLQRRPQRDIPTKEEWQELLSRSGISNDTTVLLYGDNNNWFAAFAYWLFKLYGHDDVRLINGGRKKWFDEGRESTTEVPSYPAATYTAKDADTNLRVFRDEVTQKLQGGLTLIDVRSPGEYSGQLLAPENLPQEGAQRGGHIPGAQNVPWATADELRNIYGSKGVTGAEEVIAYCRIGERSAHTWFVLHELLGYENTRNYDGSWTEWGSLIGAPIETGSSS
jgi:thiosulfate/3-mercaptopyruvate sulfurtransferase